MRRYTKQIIAALIVGSIIVLGGIYWRYIDTIEVNERTPTFTISAETTYITEPLDTHGYVDYEAAINQILSRDLRPEDNAAVYLLKAVGPKPEGFDASPRFMKALGIPKPTESPDDFVTAYRFIKAQQNANQTPDPDFESQLQPLAKRPWKAKDHPLCADWLKQNEAAFKFIVQASHCPRYYHPIFISTRELPEYEGRENLRSAGLPLGTCSYNMSLALIFRGMMNLGEGKHQEVWPDLLAAHRLSRLLSNNASLGEMSIGLGVETVVLEAELAYLQTTKPSNEAIRAMMKDLDQLPPRQPAVRCIRECERFMQLDVLQNMYRFGFSDDMLSTPVPSFRKNRAYLAMVESYDWDNMFRLVNTTIDQFCEAYDKPNRQERIEAFARLNADLERALQALPSYTHSTAIERTTGTVAKGKGERIVYTLLNHTTPHLIHAITSEHMHQQRYQNFRIACALAMYKADHGKYPETLTALHPKYLTPIPMDLFNGKPLVYYTTGAGYLLYSVGENGIDDDGQPYDGNPKGDDIVVRVPLHPVNM